MRLRGWTDHSNPRNRDRESESNLPSEFRRGEYKKVADGQHFKKEGCSLTLEGQHQHDPARGLVLIRSSVKTPSKTLHWECKPRHTIVGFCTPLPQTRPRCKRRPWAQRCPRGPGARGSPAGCLLCPVHYPDWAPHRRQGC